MVLLKFSKDIGSLLSSIVYILTFPFSLFIFCIEFMWKKVWLSFVSIALIQRLWSPRFGTNVFSRAGRLVMNGSNVRMFLGGSLTGVAILFFLYQPALRRFDGQYYVVFQQQGVAEARAEEATADAVISTAMPIVTELAPTPSPTPRTRTYITKFVTPQSLPTNFVPPAVANTGTYYSPLHNPTKLLITTRFSSGHPGIDMATEFGTPIYSVTNGYVESIGSTIWAYGNVVYVNHGNGVESLYAHMSRVDVKVGQQVTKDTILGAVGSTGHSTGPHVHLELHNNGAPFNPLGVLIGL